MPTHVVYFTPGKLLGQALSDINSMGTPDDGFYVICVEEGPAEVHPNAPGAIIFSPHEEDEEEVTRIASQEHLIPLCSVSVAQDVVDEAREQKPDVSQEELVRALNFYLDHDAYIDS